jgi:ABC-type multidrug transport system permease subunit
MNNSFFNLVAIQFRELYREPEVLFWAVFFPVVLSGVLGFAFSRQESITSKVAVINNEFIQTNSSAKALQEGNTDSLLYSEFNFTSSSSEEAFLQLKRGEIQLIVEPAASNKLIYHFDPRNENARLHYLLLEKRVTPSVAHSTIKPVVTQGSRYIDFLIPGMLALGMMNSCIWGIGWSLIEMRIKKLLRRMVATPMSKPLFLLAQFAARLALSLSESILLIIFAYYIFNVDIQGSIWSVLLMFLAGNIAFGGIAILIASRPEKTQVGSGIINFITLSLTILSGIFFSYTNFPDWAANIISLLPLTLLADSLRGIFNEGLAFSQLAGKALLLIAYGAICFIAGLRVFKWY